MFKNSKTFRMTQSTFITFSGWRIIGLSVRRQVHPLIGDFSLIVYYQNASIKQSHNTPMEAQGEDI
jgi:hypothetical protein